MLSTLGTGFGMLALADLLQAVTPPDPRNPLGARPGHFPAKAKHIIHIYLNGGPSQVDTFDPKPLLNQYAGRTLPAGNLATERHTGAALPSPFRFR
ncbi:MAG: DUF1501 domain-containing protein, partial [Planctomycetota bacterium]